LARVDKVIVSYRADNSGLPCCCYTQDKRNKISYFKNWVEQKKAQLVVLCGVTLVFARNSKAVQDVCFGNFGITSGDSGHLVYSVLVPYSAGSIMTLIFKKTGIDILAASVMGICCTARDDKVVSIITSIN
jgi:hypothetical protein